VIARHTSIRILNSVRGKIIGGDGKDLHASDFTAGTNNFLNSLFSQCSISLNGVNITPASELYPYRSYRESLLTYGSDAANSHLRNAYWYLDEGDVLARVPTASRTKALSSHGSVKNRAKL
jgi:hypothetical protein